MPQESYGSGTTLQIGDTERMLMVKEIYATASGGGGTGGGGAVMRGTGAPSGAPPGGAAAALYYDTSTGNLYEWDGTAWV